MIPAPARIGMRFAAVSDIHGNLPALEAVIADIHRRRVSTVFNLGDSLSGPLWPIETANRLMALGWPSLAGNHERQLLTLPIAEMGQTDTATAALIPHNVRDWLSTQPQTLQLNNNVLLCHGTPTSDHSYWLHKIACGRMRDATHGEIEEEATGHDLILCGHTHLSRTIALADGRQVANPGSVGLPAYDDDRPSYHVIETGTPDARYLIAEQIDGKWHVDLRSVAYDFEISARRADAAGRPTWAHALRTGRMTG